MARAGWFVLTVGLTIAGRLTLPGAAHGPADAATREWNRMEGTWTMTRLEVNGKSLLEKSKPAPKLVIKDGKVQADPKDATRAGEPDGPEVRLDPARKPKAITVPNCKGGDPDTCVTLIGIYELKGTN